MTQETLYINVETLKQALLEDDLTVNTEMGDIIVNEQFDNYLEYISEVINLWNQSQVFVNIEYRDTAPTPGATFSYEPLGAAESALSDVKEFWDWYN